MSISKIKTIALALLVVINFIFITVIIIDAAAEMRSERLALENVSAVMRAGGITVDPDSIDTGSAGASSAVTALLGFLAAVRDGDREDIWSSQIYSVELLHGDNCDHEDCESGLVWMIIADSADNSIKKYTIEGATGDIVVDLA